VTIWLAAVYQLVVCHTDSWYYGDVTARRYAVGELFEPGRRSYADGTVVFGMGMLALFMSEPTSEEIAAVRRGSMRLGVAEAGGCLFVLYSVGDLTGDVPYEWHLAPQDRRSLPELPTPRSRLLVHVFLVDADTGVIGAMRQVTMSARVSRLLVDAMRRQSQVGAFHDVEYDAKLARARRRWDLDGLVRVGTIDVAGGDASVELLMGQWSAVEGN
jgi:hypothetical protein